MKSNKNIMYLLLFWYNKKRGKITMKSVKSGGGHAYRHIVTAIHIVTLPLEIYLHNPNQRHNNYYFVCVAVVSLSVCLLKGLPQTSQIE